MTARMILCTLFVVFAGGLAGCGLPSDGSIAFDDCYNRPPLYQQQNGCYERQ